MRTPCRGTGIEVLRDGAAAQYGSDAIAGVINFQMKDASEGGTVQATYGENYDNPSSINLAANIGLPLMELGYNFNDNVRVVLAAANVFDTFIDTIGPPNANRLSVGLPYPRRKPIQSV